MQQVNEKEIRNKKLLYKTLGEIIKKLRDKDKKSVYVNSAICGMSTNSWNRVEKGISLDPSFTTIWKIAEVLGIKPSELLKEVENRLGDKFSLSGLN